MYTHQLLCRGKSSAFLCRRWKGNNPAKKTPATEKENQTKNKKYSSTVNLPKTDFPARVENGKARQDLDESLRQATRVTKLYEWQKVTMSGSKQFVLHDGPPYANGDVHVGHAVNKILKDITNRFKLLTGYQVDYRPGWDCHGLPIELKALERLASDSTSSPKKIRETANKIAEECSAKQKQSFASWGVLADFSDQSSDIYMTNSPAYEAKQIDLFGRLHQKGLIYRELKPVYWSPSSQTSLAEAELEYNPAHESTAIYVAFPVTRRPDDLLRLLPSQFHDLKWYAVIWTTTPWSLPGNGAIAFGPDMRYSLTVGTDKAGSKAVYIVGEKEMPNISREMDLEFFQDPVSFSGSELHSLTYSHPMNPARQCPFVPSTHVASGKGTGLVHTAPTHGQDDYLVGLKNKLNCTTCHVDTLGKFTEEAGSVLVGKDVLGEGTDAVIEILRGRSLLLGKRKYVHSYPYDWRTKKPVILRASEQWFIDVEKIRDAALFALEQVEMIPDSGMQIMATQLKTRPYWCISRQRVWGVPIPVYYSATTGRPLINQSSIAHISQLIQRHGADIWWKAGDDILFPDHIRGTFGLSPVDEITKGLDILDIWFESGTSWAAVLGEEKIADLNIEGNDQYGAWFQTSLLTSVALRGVAPFKKVFVHGFALDENGKKMSKSLGNVVHPSSVTEKYGVDVLRWWVAQSANGSSNFHIGPNILEECQHSLNKLRNTCRFLIGAIGTENEHFETFFSGPNSFDNGKFDAFIVRHTFMFLNRVVGYYNNMEYHKVTQEILHFSQGDELSLFLSAVKDRLYCEPVQSTARLATQATMVAVLHGIIAAIAPITPFLADEAFHSWWREYIMLPFLIAGKMLEKPLLQAGYLEWLFSVVQSIRREVNQACKSQNTIPMRLTLQVESARFHVALQDLNTGPYADRGCSELHDIFGFSQVILQPWTKTDPEGKKTSTLPLDKEQAAKWEVAELNFRFSVSPSTGSQCARCRKYNVVIDGSDICERCENVIGGR